MDLILRNDIRKLIDKWFKEKTEGYLFRDDDTYNAVLAIIDELQDNVWDLIGDANMAVDYELENAELKNGYWVERPTIDDADDFVYKCQL